MKFAQALTAAIDQYYARTLEHRKLLSAGSGEKFWRTRDQVSMASENLRIAFSVGEILDGNDFYEDEDVSYGTFDNLREHGLTVSYHGWTFCVYEHRNSDAICVEGCPDSEVQPYGPYGGADKYDVLFDTKYRDYEGAAKFLTAAMRFVKNNPLAKRDQVKDVLAQ